MSAPVRVRVPSLSHRQLLDRVLEHQDLVTAIQHLPGPALARLVDRLGVEDAGELVSLATTAQLEQLFDEDLWRSPRPGEDEHFDAARFVVWLEVMLESGARFTAARLAEMSEDFLVHVIHQRALVLDLDALAQTVEASDDPDQLEKALDDRLHHELDTYRLVARDQRGWDALVEVLAELDERHHDLLVRLLDRACALGDHEVADGGGLYDVLTSEETLAADVAAEREDRRAREGYVAPSSARAFLRLAAETDVDTARREGRDAITRAYFRELAPRPWPTLPPPTERLVGLLRESGVLDEAPAAPLLEAGDAGGPEGALRAAMSALAERDPALHALRMSELVYLVNVLVASGQGGERGVRPEEAAASVLRACARGLDHLVAGGERPEAVLARDGADLLFRIGWRVGPREP